MSENESQRVAELVGVIEDLRQQLAIAQDARAKSDEQVESLLYQVEQLTLQVAVLATRIGELTARLDSDSTNSSNPPSKDGPASKQRSLRTRSGRKSGGQPGHKGATLEMVATPDFVESHTPAACQDCGHDFTDSDEVTKVERRQVRDLPTVTTQGVVGSQGLSVARLVRALR
jgi:hypothetical protein